MRKAAARPLGWRAPGARPPGSGATAEPLAGVERVLVDGSNLAHALAGRDAAGRSAVPAPAAGVLAAVRATFPTSVRVELVFDGTGEVGITRAGRFGRAASNLFVEHAGRRAADRVIEDAVEAQLRADGPAGTWGILVVTDDRELRGIAQSKGARVGGTAWLVGRLDRARAGVGPAPTRGPGAGHGSSGGRAPSGSSIGNRRPPGRA
jgi:hypothetical protein